MTTDILTPYYRTIARRTGIQCIEEPDYNYTPYRLFCLTTRLTVLSSQIIGSNVDVRFKGIENKTSSRMVLHILLFDGDTEVKPSVEQTRLIQSAVDDYTTSNVDFCLLLPSTQSFLSIPPIPVSWLRQILNYVAIGKHYNPYVNNIGLHVNLTRYVDFNDHYDRLQRKIINRIQKMYQYGYILYASSIASKWDLEPCDSEGILYRARWTDNRFAPNLVVFLQERLADNEYISIDVGVNSVRRHAIAKVLTNKSFFFYDQDVRIKCDNIDDAKMLTSMVLKSANEVFGKVATLIPKQNIEQYINKAKSLGLNYITYYLQNTLILSILVDINASSTTTQRLLLT